PTPPGPAATTSWPAVTRPFRHCCPCSTWLSPPSPDPAALLRRLVAHPQQPGRHLGRAGAPLPDKGLGQGRVAEIDRQRVVEDAAHARRGHRPIALPAMPVEPFGDP